MYGSHDYELHPWPRIAFNGDFGGTCLSCAGSGRIALNGEHPRPCDECQGRGFHDSADIAALASRPAED